MKIKHGINNIPKIVWLLVIFFLPPFAVNIILILFSSKTIAISNSVWIGFWGSYLGAIVTLLCLILTIAYNRHQLWLETEYRRIEKIKEDVIERVGGFRTSEFLEKPLAHIDDLTVSELPLSLLELYGRYNSAINTAKLLYETPRASNKQLNFYNLYTKCLKSCNDKINCTLWGLCSMKPKDTIKSMAFIHVFVSKDTFTDVKDAASDFIKEIDENYQSLLKRSSWEILKSMFCDKYN